MLKPGGCVYKTIIRLYKNDTLIKKVEDGSRRRGSQSDRMWKGLYPPLLVLKMKKVGHAPWNEVPLVAGKGKKKLIPSYRVSRKEHSLQTLDFSSVKLPT